MFITAPVNVPNATVVSINAKPILVAVEKFMLCLSNFEQSRDIAGPATMHHKGFIAIDASGSIGIRLNKFYNFDPKNATTDIIKEILHSFNSSAI